MPAAGIPLYFRRLKAIRTGSGSSVLDHKNHDKIFFVNFGIVLAAIGGIFFVCIFAARLIAPPPHSDPQAAKHLEERIKPVATVVTDPAALVKVSAGPKRAPYSGEEVIGKVCNTCHVAGVLGAPKEGDKAAWSARLSSAGGLDGLAASAMKGKNSMPPRGGSPDLTDDEIKAAITAMLKKSGL
jgi:cytochrome c5